MNKIKKLKRLPLIIKNLDSLVGNNQFVFLISHMRSYSSLLSHIMGSHRSISGYYETHLSYKNNLDLLHLEIKLMEENNGKETIYLDKLLHNNCDISDNIINSDRVKIIVYIRKPEKTCQSILHLANKTQGMEPYQNIDYVANYYYSRLKFISDFSKRVSRDSLFFKAEDIIQDSEKILSNISSFLGLSDRLDSNYKIFKRTRQPGAGDVSNYIRRGVVVKNEHKYNTKIDEQILKKLNVCYEDVYKSLKKNCKFIS